VSRAAAVKSSSNGDQSEAMSSSRGHIVCARRRGELEEDVRPRASRLLDPARLEGAGPGSGPEVHLGPSTKLVRRTQSAVSTTPPAAESLTGHRRVCRPVSMQLLKSDLAVLSRAGQTSPIPDETWRMWAVVRSTVRAERARMRGMGRAGGYDGASVPKILPSYAASSSATTCADLRQPKARRRKQLEGPQSPMECEGLPRRICPILVWLLRIRKWTLVGSVYTRSAGITFPTSPTTARRGPDRKVKPCPSSGRSLAVGPVPSDEERLWCGRLLRKGRGRPVKSHGCTT